MRRRNVLQALAAVPALSLLPSLAEAAPPVSAGLIYRVPFIEPKMTQTQLGENRFQVNYVGPFIDESERIVSKPIDLGVREGWLNPEAKVRMFVVGKDGNPWGTDDPDVCFECPAFQKSVGCFSKHNPYNAVIIWGLGVVKKKYGEENFRTLQDPEERRWFHENRHLIDHVRVEVPVLT